MIERKKKQQSFVARTSWNKRNSGESERKKNCWNWIEKIIASVHHSEWAFFKTEDQEKSTHEIKTVNE